VRRRAARIAAAVVTGLVLASLGAATAAAAGPPAVHHHPVIRLPGRSALATPGTRESELSPNWSGYTVSGASGAYTSVAGCWTVPTVLLTPGPTYSSTWLGIDGGLAGDAYLIQTGTEQDWSSPSGSAPFSASYSAWWEILTPAAPLAPATPIPLTVSAGDTVCASIQRAATGEWVISLDDLTGAAPFTTEQPFGGPGQTAEWVVEEPEVCTPGGGCQQSNLADYGETTFDLCAVDGRGPALSAGESLTMVNVAGTQVISQPSVPDSEGDGFSVAYGSAPPPSPPSISPGLGPAAGGQTVTLTGTGFQAGAGVAFGSGAATQVTVSGATQLTAVSPPGSGTVNVTVTEPSGISATDILAYTYVASGTYTALTPFRICDTRAGSGTECSGGSADNRIGQGQTLPFRVTGVGGPQGQSVPAAAQAVMLNVTAIAGSAATYLTLYPAGNGLPATSNLNVPAGVIQANLAVVPVGTGGEVSLYNSVGSIDVAVDVEGYFAAPGGLPGAGGFHPMPPLRICDTRSAAAVGYTTECSGIPLGQGAWTRVVLSGLPPGAAAGTPSLPADGTAEAAALNLTATQGSAGTFLSVTPSNQADSCPSGPPGFSNLNVPGHTNLPNRVVVPLGPDQDICVYNSLGTIDFVVDVNGWFGNGQESPAGALFSAVPPVRVCDTRAATATECSGNSLTPGQVLPVLVAGIDQIPAAGGPDPPVAVIANVTAVAGTRPTYFTLYPADGSPAPTASDVNVGAGQITPNLAIVQLATSGINAGALDLYNNQGSIDAIVDVQGWFQ